MGFKESVSVREGGAVSRFSAGPNNVSVWERAAAMSCGVLQRRWASGLSAGRNIHRDSGRETGRKEHTFNGLEEVLSTSPDSMSPCEWSCTHLTATVMEIIHEPAWECGWS